MKKKADPSRFYIKKEDLEKVVLEYQGKVREAEKEGKPLPSQPNAFGLYIMDLCKGVSENHSFVRYSWKDMMVDDAVEACCKAIMNYDPTKVTKTNNIFNYFTMIAWRAFQNRINLERKQNYIKHKNFREMHTIDAIKGNLIIDSSANEYTDRVISEYEEKYINKKKNKKS